MRTQRWSGGRADAEKVAEKGRSTVGSCDVPSCWRPSTCQLHSPSSRGWWRRGSRAPSRVCGPDDAKGDGEQDDDHGDVVQEDGCGERKKTTQTSSCSEENAAFFVSAVTVLIVPRWEKG